MLKQRIMSRVFQTEGCWLWMGAKNENGYGVISWPHRRRQLLTHRASWAVHNGSIPDGMCVLHRCDTPLCLRPEHLFLGSRKDNVADMIGKGRAVYKRGAENGFSKLDDVKVREIRKLRRDGLTLQAIANVIGVNFRTIHLVVTNQAWQHVQEIQ